jgi:hypothetical protein
VAFRRGSSHCSAGRDGFVVGVGVEEHEGGHPGSVACTVGGVDLTLESVVQIRNAHRGVRGCEVDPVDGWRRRWW